MWNMTTYTCKLKICRLERETSLSRTESHMFALKSSTGLLQEPGHANPCIKRQNMPKASLKQEKVKQGLFYRDGLC